MRKLPVTSYLMILTLAACVGCQSASRRSLPASEPRLTTTEPGPSVMVSQPTAVPAEPTSFVGRHPILNRPKQVYDTTNNNKVIKTAKATVIGIPSGFFGELKQIAAGTPSTTTVAP